MPEWLRAVLAVGIPVAFGLWLTKRWRREERASIRADGDLNANVFRWQWIGAAVGLVIGSLQASAPWQGEGLIDNATQALVAAICAALAARATRQWLNTRRP